MISIFSASSRAFFLEWSLRSLFKTAWAGILLGVVWMLPTFLNTTYDPSHASIRYILATSFLIDTTFIFFITVLATFIGLSVQSWDAIGFLFVRSAKLLITRLLWSIVWILLAVVAVRYYNLLDQNNMIALVGINFIITSSVAFSTAYHCYLVYGVMNRHQRTSYFAEVRNRSTVNQIFQYLLPWYPGMDKTKVVLPVLWSLIIVTVSLSASLQLSGLAEGSSHTLPIYYAALSSILFTIWGLVRRVVDIVMPRGKHEQLYPYWETFRVRDDDRDPEELEQDDDDTYLAGNKN